MGLNERTIHLLRRTFSKSMGFMRRAGLFTNLGTAYGN